MKAVLAVAVACCAALPAPCSSACHFSSERVIGCWPDDGETAAEAYRNFGYDGAAMEPSYIRAKLLEAGCRVIRSAGPNSFKIYGVGHRRVPTDSGWVDTQEIWLQTKTEGRLPFVVASPYIVGKCEPTPPS